MDKRRLEIGGAVLILIGLIFVIWFILRPASDGTRDIEDNIADDGGSTVVTELPPGPVEILPNPIARVFVERFGSFSNESDYDNIEDVSSLASAVLKGRLSRILLDARSAPVSTYYGISTRVIGMNILEETETFSKIEVMTQREESIDSPANTSVRYQNIILDLVKVEGEWLVDNFSWE